MCKRYVISREVIEARMKPRTWIVHHQVAFCRKNAQTKINH